jgi:hypothetical protein
MKRNELVVSGLIASATGISFENKGLSLGYWGNADNYAQINSHTYICLEVEKEQKHPITNVVKYWPYLEQTDKAKMILLHTFFPDSPGLNSSRGKLAEYFAMKMEKLFGNRFKYFRLIIKIDGNKVIGTRKLRLHLKKWQRKV